jgi:hypothetical protein
MLDFGGVPLATPVSTTAPAKKFVAPPTFFAQKEDFDANFITRIQVVQLVTRVTLQSAAARALKVRNIS